MSDNKQEYLMLAENYINQYIGGWLASEKMDGQRCLWDGGISRGIPKADVPYANIAKDERYVDEQIATGLWSRYGNVIHAPDWWLDMLPPFPLDSELYNPKMSRQEIMKIIKKLKSEEWDAIKLHAFDSPAYLTFLKPRVCYNNTYMVKIPKSAMGWAMPKSLTSRPPKTVAQNYKFLQHILKDSNVCVAVEQIQLPPRHEDALAYVHSMNAEILSRGGEGVMLRDPSHIYETERSKRLLKFKSRQTTEGKIIGWAPGKNDFEGMLGSLLIDYNGKKLNLSGMSKKERTLFDGEPVYFYLGEIVTFSYKGLTDDGIPTEASYEHRAEITE